MQQGKNSKRARGAGFFNQRGPSIPPQKNYQPTRSANKPAGYSEIEAASQFGQDSPDFIAFVRDVVKMIRLQHTISIDSAFSAALEELHNSPRGLPSAEQFVQRVNAINTDYAPAEVKQALAGYRTSLAQSMTAAKNGEDMVPYEDAVNKKLQLFRGALKRNEK